MERERDSGQMETRYRTRSSTAAAKDKRAKPNATTTTTSRKDKPTTSNGSNLNTTAENICTNLKPTSKEEIPTPIDEFNLKTTAKDKRTNIKTTAQDKRTNLKTTAKDKRTNIKTIAQDKRNDAIITVILSLVLLLFTLLCTIQIFQLFCTTYYSYLSNVMLREREMNRHHDRDTRDSWSPPNTGAIINLDHGDPVMFESFWKKTGDRATVVISGSDTMSSFSDTSHICWFLESDLETQVRRLHRLVGNAVAHDERHVVVGVASTQLMHAVLFALSSVDNQHSVPVVSAVPYNSMYSGIVNLLKSGLFHWAGDASSFEGRGNSSFIEIVCSPNNPDGAIRHAVLDAEGGKRVHDLAYYWPQYTPMRGPADEDIMLFTVSKATGHAGTQIGWALVKDEDVARRMVKFIEMSSIGVSKDAQIRAARILQVVSDGYELPDSKGPGRLFHFSRRLLADRWQRLYQSVKESGRFSLPQFPSQFCEFTKENAGTYPAFAWLKCDDESIEDCEGFFKGIKVLTRSGRHFGAGPEYISISMLDRDKNFDLFVKRISSVGLG